MYYLCNIIKLFSSLFFLIYSNQFRYIFLILLVLLLKCNSYKNYLINFIFNILLFLNIFIIFVNNISYLNFNIGLITIYFIYILKIIYEIQHQNIKILFTLITSIIYFIVISISLKLKNHISNLNIININKSLKKKNLRVALCISGRLDENIEEIYYSWKKNLLQYYDVDIFMNINKNNNFIEEYIKPKRIEIFDNTINKNNELHKYANLMFYRIYQTNKYRLEYEKKFAFKYDIVIRLRSDILLNERLHLENFNKNAVYFPFKENISESCNIYTLGVTDQFFIGNDKLMNQICNFYEYIEHYDFIKCKISEISLLYYLNKNNINFIHFKYNWIINHYNNNFINNLKFYKRTLWILSQSCFINLK